MSKLQRTLRLFPRTFWISNTMELFERWAWYGMFMILGLYLTKSTDTGALGFSQEQKGLLMGTVVGILYFLPIITGAIADKFGYKKVLIASYLILSSGYILMGLVSTYFSMWIVFLYVAIGAGLFKPVITATISKTTDKKTSSLGFGIFYMIVNVGAFLGPIMAGQLRKADWFLVFLMSAIAIGVNLIFVLSVYKEPGREKKTEPLGQAILSIFRNIGNALGDIKLLMFLLIIAGFWTMYNQLFYMLPVFIDQWVDTSGIYNGLASLSPGLAKLFGTAEGQILPEYISDLDALYIVILQVFVSTIIMKYKPINMMMTGFLVCTLGITLWFVTQNGIYLFLSIMLFGIGEMISSPKILEYIGNLAPRDKVALYMGCYFIPMALGNFLAGLISGNVYAGMSDKITLLQREIKMRGMEIPEISKGFTQNDYINKACELMNMNEPTLTRFLWETYHPSQIWIVLSAIGAGTVLLLYIYNRILFKNLKM